MRMAVHAATAKPVKAGRRTTFGIVHTLETVESAQSSNVSHRISVSRGKKGEAASLSGGHWRLTTLVVIHYHVRATKNWLTVIR